MNLKLIYYDFKNLRGYYFIPILILYVLTPILNVSMVKMSGSIENAYYLVFREAEKYLPILSTWWITFVFREYIEGDGNEILYCIDKTGKLKINQILFILIWYIFHVSILFLVYSVFWDNVFLQYIKIVIQCLFFTSLIYMLIYTLKSTTVSFMILLIYELFVLFMNSKITNYISVFENGKLINIDTISSKYVAVLFISIILLIIGMIKNNKFY